MSEIVNKTKGRIEQAVGDLIGNSEFTREGERDEETAVPELSPGRILGTHLRLSMRAGTFIWAAAVVAMFSVACGDEQAKQAKQAEQAQADNPAPDGYVAPDPSAGRRPADLAEKLLKVADAPDGLGLGDTLILDGVPGVDQRPCNGFCAVAATRGILLYKGMDVSMDAIAAVVQPGGGCASGLGTCLIPIVDYLNTTAPNLPWAGFYVPYRLNHDSLDAAAYDLERVIRADVGTFQMPLMVLLNPNPPDNSPYCLDGWCEGGTQYGHYITIIGITGAYDGTDGSCTVYYRDSWAAPGVQHQITLNGMVHAIFYKDGQGSCSGDAKYNVIW